MHNFPFDFHFILTDNCVFYYYYITNKQTKRKKEVRSILNWHKNNINQTIAAQTVHFRYKKYKFLFTLE